jgi:hypothetical protein
MSLQSYRMAASMEFMRNFQPGSESGKAERES